MVDPEVIKIGAVNIEAVIVIELSRQQVIIIKVIIIKVIIIIIIIIIIMVINYRFIRIFLAHQ